MLWCLVTIAALVLAVWAGATVYYKGRAHELYATWSRVDSAPGDKELRSDFGQLIALAPGLAKIDYRYLSQPLDETQQYLLEFAMGALSTGDKRRWELAVRILNGIWLKERQAPEMDLARAIRLNTFQQRIRGLYAQARFKRIKAALPAQDRLAYAHNIGSTYVRKQWENEWALWGGALSWYRACQTMDQLSRWEKQMAGGQPLEAGPPATKPVYEVLKAIP
ncbi:hypothetical protein ABS71_15000 [bacterium SCN 62-11]|nr:MAG: hypothetical protein ABS71_15000 [bacterium SCN 62-11]